MTLGVGGSSVSDDHYNVGEDDDGAGDDDDE